MRSAKWALNRKKSNLVEPVLLKMADLLRYMLYEKDDKRISLENEIKYLTNYIDLQKVRFGEYVNINFDVNTSDSSKSIEPMLLIPFVENAFKHGVGLIEDPFIKIELVATNDDLSFKVVNKFSSDSIFQISRIKFPLPITTFNVENFNYEKNITQKKLPQSRGS